MKGRRWWLLTFSLSIEQFLLIKAKWKEDAKKDNQNAEFLASITEAAADAADPDFFFYSLFPFDSDDDQNSYSIPVSVESFYSCWQRFVWGKTWQLLFKRFMQENCRLSLMDANFYGVDGGRKDNSTINTSYQKIFILWELRANCLWHTFGLGQ